MPSLVLFFWLVGFLFCFVCCYWQVWFQFCYFGSAGSSSWDCISHLMAESLKGLRFITETTSRVFNHKSSWNNLSDNSLLFFPFFCRFLMTLQSISMKTTQNVQVMLIVGQTAIVLLCPKCAFFFYCITWVLFKVVLLKKARICGPDRLQTIELNFGKRHTLISWKVGEHSALVLPGITISEN